MFHFDPGTPFLGFDVRKPWKTDLEPLGTPLEPLLAPSWAHLGAILGPCWAILGPSWGHLGPPWAILGTSWGLLALSFGLTFNILTQMGHVGDILLPCWTIGALLCSHIGDILPPCWTIGARSRPSILQPGLAECAQRLNPPHPPGGTACWTTFKLFQTLSDSSEESRQRSRNPQGRTRGAGLYPALEGFTVLKR